MYSKEVMRGCVKHWREEAGAFVLSFIVSETGAAIWTAVLVARQMIVLAYLASQCTKCHATHGCLNGMLKSGETEKGETCKEQSQEQPHCFL
jgi:hypothetical protein